MPASAADFAQLAARLDDLTETTETVWTLCVASLIFLMQVGFAMLEAGTVRDRSVRDVRAIRPSARPASPVPARARPTLPVWTSACP